MSCFVTRSGADGVGRPRAIGTAGSRGLAEALLNHGELLSGTGKLQEAEDALRRSVTGLSGISAVDVGGLAASRVSVARARGLLGDVLAKLGRYDEAVAEINRLCMCADWWAWNLTTLNIVVHRAGTSVSLAIVLGILGRRQEQASVYERALADYDELKRSLPGVALFQESLAITRIDLGSLLDESACVQEAETQLIEANSSWTVWWWIIRAFRTIGTIGCSAMTFMARFSRPGDTPGGEI